MKYFLKKTLIFLLLPLFSFIGLLLLFSISNSLVIFNEFKDNNIKYLIAGDSHIRQSFNDEKIKNAKNIAQNSESYYFTYFKLKEIFKTNRNIKTVYLGLSYHNLSGYLDDFIFGKFSAPVAKNYYFIMPFSEKIRLIIANKKEPLNFFKSIISANFKNLFTKEKSFMGGYNNVFSNSEANKVSIEKRIAVQFFDKKKRVYDPAATNIRYLHEIIDLCRANKVGLVLINPPVDKYYEHKIPKEYKHLIKEVVKRNELHYLDFHDLKLDESYFIPDGDHVSVKGAEICTQRFKQHLKNPDPDFNVN